MRFGFLIRLSCPVIRHVALSDCLGICGESITRLTIPVTSPQSNGMSESFVKTLKRDYAKLANRPDSKTVMAKLKDWSDDYNSYHPHSALGYLPPTLFREKRSVT